MTGVTGLYPDKGTITPNNMVQDQLDLPLAIIAHLVIVKNLPTYPINISSNVLKSDDGLDRRMEVGHTTWPPHEMDAVRPLLRLPGTVCTSPTWYVWLNHHQEETYPKIYVTSCSQPLGSTTHHHGAGTVTSSPGPYHYQERGHSHRSLGTTSPNAV